MGPENAQTGLKWAINAHKRIKTTIKCRESAEIAKLVFKIYDFGDPILVNLNLCEVRFIQNQKKKIQKDFFFTFDFINKNNQFYPN